MMNKEEMNKATETLNRKAAAGAAILGKGTREAVKLSEFTALMLEVEQAKNKQEALINALITMYHAGAAAGAAIERRTRKTTSI